MPINLCIRAHGVAIFLGNGCAAAERSEQLHMNLSRSGEGLDCDIGGSGEVVTVEVGSC
jgi:hypothetical protein